MSASSGQHTVRDSMPALIATHVAKRFGTQHVLQDVTMVLGRGRVCAVLGPNGAGKTTLIKCILGLTRADAGSIVLDGQMGGSEPASRATIGYMPQIARFPDNLSGAEVVAMLTDLRGTSVVTDRELVERFGLGEEMTKPLRTLSGGTRQKVNAVLAFLFSPSLLILDEPTAGLDPVASGVLKDKVLRERARGKTFIVTSHIMSELEELADDIVFLLDGTVRFAGSLHELKVTTRQLNLERAVASLMRGEAA